MKLGFIGLGRMGHNMVLRLNKKGHTVVAYDINAEAVEDIKESSIEGVNSISELMGALEKPRTVWIMVPRAHVQNVVDELISLLEVGDTIIDGGNTYYKDSMRRAKEAEGKGIGYIDVGVSGGIEAALDGASVMVGGRKDLFDAHEPLFKDLSVSDGYGYMGTSGAGHFVKMVHNAIEYGMMSALGEGMQVIEEQKSNFNIDMGEVIKVYEHGSIIESRLLGWLSRAWRQDQNLSSITGEVPYGETEEEMERLEEVVNMPILHNARMMRVESRNKSSFAGKVLAALRNQFGGHAVKKKE